MDPRISPLFFGQDIPTNSTATAQSLRTTVSLTMFACIIRIKRVRSKAVPAVGQWETALAYCINRLAFLGEKLVIPSINENNKRTGKNIAIKS